MKLPFTFEFKRWYVIVRGRYNQPIMGMGWAAQPPALFTQTVPAWNQRLNEDGYVDDSLSAILADGWDEEVEDDEYED